MTDNLPAVRGTEPTREVTRAADVDSWTDVIADVSKLSSMIAGTEFVPRSLRDSPAATAAAILYGREVGLPPMTALSQTHVIEGKPSISAEGMRALILAAGHDLEIEDTTSARCVIRGRRRGTEKWLQLAWSIDDARQAGLLGRGPWKTYPRAMLQARATTEIARLLFPDVIRGFRSIEELEDGGAVETDPPTAEQQQPSSKVARTRKATAARKAPAALPAPPAQRPAPVVDGPPLPGEDGYDEEPTSKAPPAPSDDTAPGTQPAVDGHDPEDAHDDAPAAEAVTDADPAPEGGGEAPEGAGPAEAATVTGPRAMTKPQSRMLFARLSELGVDNDDREERLNICATIVGRDLASSNDLTRSDAQQLLDTLAELRDRDALYTHLDEIDAARAQGVDGVNP